jgi:hypothetical protein
MDVTVTKSILTGPVSADLGTKLDGSQCRVKITHHGSGPEIADSAGYFK